MWFGATETHSVLVSRASRWMPCSVNTYMCLFEYELLQREPPVRDPPRTKTRRVESVQGN